MATWLIMWEASRPELLPPKRIALALDGRTAPEQVRKVIEALYASYSYSEADLIINRVAARNPYRATFGNLGRAKYQGHITCGHNPFLFGRLVDNLKAHGDGTASWDERPRPQPRL